MTVHELRAKGKSIRQIAEVTGHSRNTIRKYLRLRGLPQPKPRPPRPSKLDPFVDDLRAWMDEGIFNCEILFEKLVAKGYTGKRSILRAYVSRFRPPRRPKAVMRFETRPGEQAQVDWGVLKYRVAVHPKALLPKTIVPLPGQYHGIPLTQPPRHRQPVAVQVPTPEVECRSLLVYESLVGGAAR